MVYTVYVRERHIRQGKPKDDVACPLALAISDDTGEGVRVTDTTLEDGCNQFLGELHPEAERFVERFDNGKHVEPGRVKVCNAGLLEDRLRGVEA